MKTLLQYVFIASILTLASCSNEQYSKDTETKDSTFVDSIADSLSTITGIDTTSTVTEI